MFKITDNLATHGLGGSMQAHTLLEDGYLDGTDFWIVDVRDMLDSSQPLEAYKRKIDYAVSCLNKYEKIVVCCRIGASRSNAIALGVLVKHYKMDFYDAYNLVREKVPIAQIHPGHIERLKELFTVGLP